MTPIYYRLWDVLYSAGVTVRVEKFLVVEETPCGHWVRSEYAPTWRSVKEAKKHKELRWVSKTSVKAYCYPPLSEAIQSFLRRKERQAGILRAQLEQVEKVLDLRGMITPEALEGCISRGLTLGKIPSCSFLDDY